MKLEKYMKSLSREELQEFAEKAETSIPYLKQIASGHRNAGVKSLMMIPPASNGLVTINDLRPKAFGSAA